MVSSVSKKKSGSKVMKLILHFLHTGDHKHMLDWYDKENMIFEVTFTNKRNSKWSKKSCSLFEAMDMLKKGHNPSSPRYYMFCRQRFRSNLAKLCKLNYLKYCEESKIKKTTVKCKYKVLKDGQGKKINNGATENVEVISIWLDSVHVLQPHPDIGSCSPTSSNLTSISDDSTSIESEDLNCSISLTSNPASDPDNSPNTESETNSNEYLLSHQDIAEDVLNCNFGNLINDKNYSDHNAVENKNNVFAGTKTNRCLNDNLSVECDTDLNFFNDQTPVENNISFYKQNAVKLDHTYCIPEPNSVNQEVFVSDLNVAQNVSHDFKSQEQVESSQEFMDVDHNIDKHLRRASPVYCSSNQQIENIEDKISGDNFTSTHYPPVDWDSYMELLNRISFWLDSCFTGDRTQYGEHSLTEWLLSNMGD